MIVARVGLRVVFMKRSPAIVLLLLTASAPAAPAQTPVTVTGRVVAVGDGDSLTVLDGRRQVHVRLHGVDAPEGRQAFGSVCKRVLSNLVFGKAVTVEVLDVDRYRRGVSRVTADGTDVGLEMIRSGCAWHYTQYSKDARYAAAEQEARRARRGLWQDPAPVAPWEFRRRRAAR